MKSTLILRRQLLLQMLQATYEERTGNIDAYVMLEGAFGFQNRPAVRGEINAFAELDGCFGFQNRSIVMGDIAAYVSLLTTDIKVVERLQKARGQINATIAENVGAKLAEKVERGGGDISGYFDELTAYAKAQLMKRAYGETSAQVALNGFANMEVIKETMYVRGKIAAQSAVNGFAKANIVYKVDGNIALNASVNGAAKIADESRISLSSLTISAKLDGETVIADKVIRVSGTLANKAKVEGQFAYAASFRTEENEAGGLTYYVTSDNYTIVDNAVYIGG